MTVRLGDRTGPGPDGGADDDRDDETWWDRHGWEVPAPVTTARADAGYQDSAPREQADAKSGEAAGSVRWSTLLLSVALLGGVVTLPVLGFTGGPGRVLTPTLWALIGLAVGVGLSHREPRWDLGEARRLEPLLAWVLAYAVTATIGLRFFEGVVGWWLPATVLTALSPLVTARIRRLGGH